MTRASNLKGIALRIGRDGLPIGAQVVETYEYGDSEAIIFDWKGKRYSVHVKEVEE